MFLNEYDLLEGRLEYLYDVVDYFVIVENDTTHSGSAKPMNYANNSARYRKYQKKILYYPMSTDLTKYDWNRVRPQNIVITIDLYSASMAMDTDQRNYIATALKLFKPNDIVMISDLDEIPSHAAIKSAMNAINNGTTAVSLVQDMFYYNLKQKQTTPWVGTVISSNKSILERNPQWFRRHRWNLPNIPNAGWHLSYWGSLDKIQYKIKSFCHQEFAADEFTDIDKITQRVKEGRDIFNRENNPPGTQVEFEPVDRSKLPQDLLKVFAKYEPKHIPHFYKSVDGWFTDGDIDFYKEMFDRFKGPAHFVEIGSYKGKSSGFMAVEIANSNKNIKFDCVDTWQGSPEHYPGQYFQDTDVVKGQLFETFTKNMESVKGYYNPIRMSSKEAANLYQDLSLDFVFIDADHSYESVREDILTWWPKIKVGGIISGHDYHNWAPGVMKATNELFGHVRVIANCWWTQKEKHIE